MSARPVLSPASRRRRDRVPADRARRFARLVLLVALVAPLPRAQGVALGFEETFALAVDRAATLDELIPGTPDAYYYTCLARQHAGAFDEVPPLLVQWESRHGRSPALEEIEHRQALLTSARDPAATYAYLTDRLDLRHDHQRDVPGAVPDLPTRLDPARLDWESLARDALARHPGSLRGFEDRALPALLARDLEPARLAELLSRLERPDHENLPALVVRHLREPRSGAFGSLPLHHALTLAQLDECARLEASLLGARDFVDAYARRLQPPAFIDWQHDATEREAYLVRLEAFARRLPGSRDDFLAHVLYHRLVHDHARGVHDTQRFLDYLAIHRAGAWVRPEYARTRSPLDASVSLNESYATGLPPVGNDEALIRALLEHDFTSADGYERYEPYLRPEILRRVFAETKILYGLGDPERWYSMLDDPAGYEALKDRVEIEFAPTQLEHFAVDAPVVLDVDVKNVGTLILKVFEIDALAVYTQRGTEIDASLELDGLVAHEQATYSYDEPPVRRVRRRFELPSLDGPGVWVVELIGNGVSSRALVRKGQLRAREHQGAAGHVFAVFDERGTPLPDASIVFGGREYPAGADGEIVLPYSGVDASRPLVLRHGDRATLARFAHADEQYTLGVRAWLERENLLPGATAHVVVRPELRLNGRPVSLARLRDPVLTLGATRGDGIATTTEVVDLVLADDAEIVHAFAVPDALVGLTVGLRGTVSVASRGGDEPLVATAEAFALSAIRPTTRTSCALLTRTPQGYVLEVRGRNGEPVADRVVDLALRHADFRDPVTAQLKTDAGGRVLLGALPGIRAVRAVALADGEDDASWELVPARRTVPTRLRAAVGETIRVPDDGEPVTADVRALASLLELRDGVFAHDRIDHVALEDGTLVLSGLPAGEYSLRLRRSGREVAVSVAPGPVHDGWAIGRDALVPLDDVAPLHVAGLAVEGDALVVRLAHAGPAARVHVTATRYLPAYHAYGRMYPTDAADEAARQLPALVSTYNAGQRLGDEARYILERRFATTFPGNMLARPSLLLNPWELRESETDVGGGGGHGFGGASRGKAGGSATPAATPPSDHDRVPPSPGEVPDLAFLPAPARVLANLRADADGLVRVPLAELGPGHIVHVLALDAETAAYRTLVRDPAPLQPRDLRLRDALPADAHVAEQRLIELVPGGAPVVVEDVTTSELELYDSLGAAFALFATLDPTDELDAWRFLLRWPELTRDERLARYDEFASHELHLFLHAKDPAFFAEVVRPFLENKSARTFLDRWLLDEDLRAYLEPFAFSRLNVLERILLARRMPEQAAAIARRVADDVDLIPPDPERARRLFETTLSGSALRADGGFGAAVRDAEEAATLETLRSLGYLGESGGRDIAAEAPVGAVMPAEAPPSGDREFLTGRGRKTLDDALDLDAPAPLYRGPGRVKAWVEHDYWHRRVHEQDSELLTPTPFWLDFARTPPGQAFLSTHLAQAARHVNEMLLALALLDLPFAAGEPVTARDGARLTITPSAPALLVRKELRAAAPHDAAPPLLVGQQIVRLDEPWRFEDGRRREAFVEGELLSGVVYVGQVVVSNTSSEPHALELLVQVPEGALALANGEATAGVDLLLEPLESRKHEVHFYFPAPGTFALYPAHVSQEGRFVAAAAPRTLSVLAQPRTVDETSWEHVSQMGTLEQVLAFVAQANPGRLDLARLAWRMRDRAAFERVLGVLRGRHLFERALWGYGPYHADARATGELLQMESGFLARCGPVLDAPLVRIDPVERRLYEHVEFDPLVNERAHRFGESWRILNPDLARQYEAFLRVLRATPRLDDADWLEVTYYLLLQDRVQEALAAFARVDREALDARLQYDYAAAYLDFFSDEHALARALAEPYRDHPVPRWRHRFADVLHQLDEAAGGDVAVADPKDRVQGQTALAADQPSLELDVTGGRVVLRHANLAACEIGYYAMDIEFLFSANPFVEAAGDVAASIRPNQRDRLVLDPAGGEIAFALPDAFGATNVLVEVRGGGVVRRQAHYANTMAVTMIETYGQLVVTDAADGRPLPRVYVKVYARTDGGDERFHKDGYTDLRGRFDYVAHSAESLAPAAAYAILVLSEDHGAVIREVAPPVE